MRPPPKVWPVVREMIGLVVDKIVGRAVQVEPVVFDAERHAAWRDMVEKAHRIEAADRFDVFPEDDDASRDETRAALMRAFR